MATTTTPPPPKSPFASATDPGLPGTTSMSLGGVELVVNCKPGVSVNTSKRRAAFAPFRCAQIVCPSLEIAIRLGSLPMKTDGPTAAVTGLIFVMLLPFAPALAGTLA